MGHTPPNHLMVIPNIETLHSTIGTLDPSGKYNRLLQYTIVSTRINSYKDA